MRQICFAVAFATTWIFASHAAPVAPPPALPAGWTTIYEGDLSKETLNWGWVSDHWAVRSGEWANTAEGLQKSDSNSDGLLLFRHPLTNEAFRIEYTAKSDTPCDMSLSFNTMLNYKPSKSFTCESMQFLFGSAGNRLSKLIIPGQATLTNDTVLIIPGQWHHVVAERTQGRLKITVDNRTAFDVPLEKMDTADPYPALYAWTPAVFRDFRISVPGPAGLPPAAKTRDFRVKAAMTAMDLFVALQGNDTWSGRLPARNEAGTDGPLATPQEAMRRFAQMRNSADGLGGGIQINLRGGVYTLAAPLVFTPENSGVSGNRSPTSFTQPRTVTLAGYSNETAVISGGRRISNFTATRVNGVAAWVAHLPEVRSGQWHFEQLWVNGQRAAPASLPKAGLFRVTNPAARAQGGDAWQGDNASFQYAGSDLNPAWRNLSNIVIHAFNFWCDAKMRIQAIDPASRTVNLDRNCMVSLIEDENSSTGAPYRVENVYEALTLPGEWYLDHPAGDLYYIPRPGEEMATTEVIAPALTELVRLEGTTTQQVSGVHFKNLTFAHNEYQLPPGISGYSQAASGVPGAIAMTNANNCSIQQCRIENIGTYGVSLDGGCWNINIAGNRLTDLGGGGVRVWEGCGQNQVNDNDIGHGGMMFEAAVGILVGQASGNEITHNRIHDLGYTGISVGWHWGYELSGGAGNVVEYNDIFNIGRGLLSDMGGIYTLGIQNGGRIRYNRIDHVIRRRNSGWGIYMDEGSSRILIENNICTRCEDGNFNQNYGQDNIVRNNIFAFGTTDELSRNFEEEHSSFTFERNIIIGNQPYIWSMLKLKGGHMRADRNIYWCTTGKDLRFGEKDNPLSWPEWQAKGLDQHSLTIDPRFVNPQAGDFRFKRGAPYGKIGFIPFDLSTVGPRPEILRP